MYNIKLIQVTAKKLPKLRTRLLQKQGGMCPILKMRLTSEEAVVDHKHRTKEEPIGVDGAGLVRGVIHRQANVIEGKIANMWKRYGMHNIGISIPEFLRNLADYLEQEPTQFIHPSEIEKPKVLKKSSYNALKKVYDGKARFPEYKTKQKLTKPLERLFIKYGIKPEFYK